MKSTVIATLLLLFSFNSFASGYSYFEGKLTNLEPTYLPQVITFQLDNGNVTCPKGTHLKWSKADIENNKAVYSTLLAAFLSGKRIRFYISNGDTSCTGAFLHLLNS